MYIDTHIHLQDYKTQDVKDVVNNAIKNKVFMFINPSSHPSDWSQISALSAQFSPIIPAYGIHPWHISAADFNWDETLEQIITETPRALIGECGIDTLKNPNIESQVKVLNQHILLANKYSRPLIIHSVKADSYFQNILSSLPHKTVFHSFTGSAEWGTQLQKHNFYLGLNFSIFRKKNYAEIIKNISLQHLLLETDGPYQNLNPRDGETLPQNLPLLAAKIAEIKQIPLPEFIQILEQNQQHFIGDL